MSCYVNFILIYVLGIPNFIFYIFAANTCV